MIFLRDLLIFFTLMALITFLLRWITATQLTHRLLLSLLFAIVNALINPLYLLTGIPAAELSVPAIIIIYGVFSLLLNFIIIFILLGAAPWLQIKNLRVLTISLLLFMFVHLGLFMFA